MFMNIVMDDKLQSDIFEMCVVFFVTFFVVACYVPHYWTKSPNPNPEDVLRDLFGI